MSKLGKPSYCRNSIRRLHISCFWSGMLVPFPCVRYRPSVCSSYCQCGLSLCRLSMKPLSLDTEVATNSIAEVLQAKLAYISFLIYLMMSQKRNYFFRINNKSTIWSCGAWWTLPFTISWSLLLSRPWHKGLLYTLYVLCHHHAYLVLQSVGVWKIF